MRYTLDILKEHKISVDEYDKIVELIGREPNLVELGMFGAMWSEHCSYKSSKIHLKRLPTQGDCVVCGPGENAGIIDIGHGQVLVFKIESHNHPSFIDPYSGAATGVGGILRDIFTMGARPIAVMNSLKFGDPADHKTKFLINGVVSGISDYGNCVGIPTVGGECSFDPAYNKNNLVNVMAVGLAYKKRIFYSDASLEGGLVVYAGRKTGDEGVNAASMASDVFTDADEEKFSTMRPKMQMAGPFSEKLLIEACLELMRTDAIVAIQDMGAAGLTCSSVEMSSKGNKGISIDLNRVPLDGDITPYQIMLSETQERMLMVVKPNRLGYAAQVFDKWEVPWAHIGEITNTGQVQAYFDGDLVVDVPVNSFEENAPVYVRPRNEQEIKYEKPYFPSGKGVIDPLVKILSSPDFCSKRWIWQQYDQTVMGDTLLASGGDAAMVRIHGTDKAVSVSTDSNPHACKASPFWGAAGIVAEAYRNVTATGADPLAVTNCLNFGSPENPDVMEEFSQTVDGMALACTELSVPVVSGNVSFYNETSGQSILPTPTIGIVGLLENYGDKLDISFKKKGDVVFMVGETRGYMGQSAYARLIDNRITGEPARPNFVRERLSARFIKEAAEARTIRSCHDVSAGGIAVALAEMCIAGKLGFKLSATISRMLEFMFAEDHGRYIVACDPKNIDKVEALAYSVGVNFLRLGVVGGRWLTIGDETIPINKLLREYERWLISYMK